MCDKLGLNQVELGFRVLRVGRDGKFIDERLERFFRLYHVDLCSFDVLYVLEVDESFKVEGVGERRRRGVGLDEGLDFDEGFDFLLGSVKGEGEQDLRARGEIRVGVVVRDDLQILDGFLVSVVSESGYPLCKVLLDLLLGEARDEVALF